MSGWGIVGIVVAVIVVAVLALAFSILNDPNTYR